MKYWKQSILALLGLSVLALAGCSQAPTAPDGGPGPTAADKAAAAAAQQNGGQAAKEAALARGKAGANAASTAKAAPAAGTTGQ